MNANSSENVENYLRMALKMLLMLTLIVTDSFSGINTLQKQIIAAYRDDIRKYAEGVNQTRITRVFDSIPVHLSIENKKFQVSKVASGA